MRSIGLKVLKNKLSEYVRIVATGETVLITDRDRVVAEMIPPQGGKNDVADAYLMQLLRNGWMVAPASPNHEAPPRKPIGTWAELCVDLADDRQDR